ncbi:DedA family protein [Helicobacter typhlonius]|uniref:DedA family protein n=1 Tax=Helicobacter typhlonius TaxID=76936 RepID=UPI002FE2889C
MQDIIVSLEKWGYILLFLFSLGGGYVGLLTAGVMSALGKMDIIISILTAGVGNIIGSSLLAYLARYQKNDLMAYLSNHRRKIALSQVWLKKYGVWLIFFSKYLYGIKTIVPLAIGFSRFSIKTFFIFNAMSCAIWAVVVGICGYYASSGVISVLEEINAHSYVMPIVLLCIGIILYLIISFVSKRARKSL